MKRADKLIMLRHSHIYKFLLSGFIFLACFFAATLSYATCSSYKDLATINEVNRSGGATRFVEIKILDSSIPASTYNNWTIRICNSDNQCTGPHPLGSGDTSGYPWLIIDQNVLPDKQSPSSNPYIDLRNGFDIILEDASGNTIDYLSVNSYTAQQDTSCTPTFDWDWNKPSNNFNTQTIARSPDGTGTWETTGPGNSGGNTSQDTNDTDPNGNPAPQVTVNNVVVSKGQTAVFTLTLPGGPVAYDITVDYQTIDATALAGTDYVTTSGTATITSGTSTTTIPVNTIAASTSPEVFFKLFLSNPVNGSLVNHFPIGTILPNTAGAWYMDESAWNGTSGDVVDGSGNNTNGTSFNGLTTSSAFLCNGGNFDGINDYIQIPHKPILNGLTALTYSAWLNPNSWSGVDQIMAKSVHGGGSGRAQMGIFSESGVLKGRAETLSGRYDITTSLPAINNWTHVALVFTGDSLRMYINGTLVASDNFSSTSLQQTTDPLMISKRYPNSTYFFNGLIDEVLVFQSALGASSVQTIYNNYQNGLSWDGSVRTCSTLLDHIEIQHDGSGLTCNPEIIQVRACVSPDCSILSTSNVTVSLLPTGWVGGDTQIITGGTSTFQLRNTTPGLVTLAVSSSVPAVTNPAVCLNTSNGSNSCDLTFYETGFVYTIPTQTACATSTNINVAAVRKDITTQQCIPAFANRNEAINFWSTYISPASGGNTLTLNNGTTDFTLATAPTGTAVPLNFDTNGEASITLNYRDAGQLTLNSSFSGTGTEAGLTMTGATTFATIPAKLYTYTNDLNSDCAAADLSCSRFRQAGQSFNLNVRAACADNTVTPNFQHNSISITHNLIAPVAGVPGTIGNTAFDMLPGDAGEHSITDQSVSEVGVFTYTAQLSGGTNYFGASAIGTPALNSSVNIGRFFPSYFDVTRIHGCAAGAFTYSGQPFSVTSSAFNNVGGITQNYDGSLAFAFDTTVSDNTGATTNFTNNVIPANTYTAGVGTRTDVTYTFPLVTTLPTNVTLRSIDADTVSSVGHLEESTMIHSGRIAIENAFGSELIDLSVPTTVQHYTGSDFVNFSADVCSTMSLSMTKVDGTLNVGNGGTVGDTCIWDDSGDSGANNCSAAAVLPGPALFQYREPPTTADFNLYLKPPGAGFTGNVDVTGIVDSWLQFDWSGTGATNPTGRATFGIYRGDDRIIYWRERFD